MIEANIEVLEERLATLESHIRDTRRLLDRVRAVEDLNRQVPVLIAGARNLVAQALDQRAGDIRRGYERIEQIYTAQEPVER